MTGVWPWIRRVLFGDQAYVRALEAERDHLRELLSRAYIRPVHTRRQDMSTTLPAVTVEMEQDKPEDGKQPAQAKTERGFPYLA